MTAATAHRIIVGNLSDLWNESYSESSESIAPKDTPFVA